MNCAMKGLLSITIWYYLVLTIKSDSCNERRCAPIVSKCLLLTACSCTIDVESGTCECCTRCTECLASLYKDCCGCVGVCDPKADFKLSNHFEWLPLNLSGRNPISDPRKRVQMSQDFQTVTRSDSVRAKVGPPVSYPQTNETFIPNYIYDYEAAGVSPESNCSSVFLLQCMTLEKCSAVCKFWNSISARFFVITGCCQCVDPICDGYGINEEHCSECPDVMEDPIDRTERDLLRIQIQQHEL